MSPSENKLQVFVSSTHEDLRPYREKVIQLLTHLGYAVVSEDPTLGLPVRRLNQVESCDLFIGIYPPDSGVLPDILPGYDDPLPLVELKHAGQTLRDGLIYIAQPELAGLVLLQPPEPAAIAMSRYPKLEPLSPPKLLRGLAYWKQAFRAWFWREPTPQELNEAKRQQYKRRVEEWERLKKVVLSQQQREQTQLKAEARAAFEIARQQYAARRELTLELQKEARNFPYHPFASENELLSFLQHDLNALETGELLPFAKNRTVILAHWQKWLDYHLHSIRQHLFYPRVLQFPSPVEVLLADFLSQKWHERAQEVAGEVVKAVNAIHIPHEEIQNKLVPYRRLPVQCESANYLVITQKLNEWCVGAGETAVAIEEWVGRIGDTPERPGSLPYKRIWDEKVDEWQKSIRHLEYFLDHVSYGKCLLITGRSGSGKTHLVARLLQQHDEELGLHLPYYLYISPEIIDNLAGDKPTIETLLMASARFYFPGSSNGPSWRSFTDLAQFVNQNPKDSGNKLVVIFDDLDVWLQRHQFDLADLCQFIKNYTNLHHVYWVLCLSENHFDLVSGASLERFWKQYSFTGNVDTTLSGWVEIDRLNESSQQWRKIVAYQWGKEDDNALNKVVAHLVEETRKLVQIPFVAWLFGRFLREGKLPDELKNLNYIEFVEAFWQQQLARSLPPTSTGEPTLARESLYWRAIYLIAGLIMETKTTLLRQSTLSERLIYADGQRTDGFADAVDAVLKKLVQTDLLETSPEPAEVGRHGHQVAPGGFLPMWHWKSGEYLVDALHGKGTSVPWPLDDLHRLLETHFNEEELRTLCFHLGVEYEELSASGKSYKARELVQYLNRTNRVSELVEYGHKTRPHANWGPTPGQVTMDEVETWIQQRFLTGWSQKDKKNFLPGVLEFLILVLNKERSPDWWENHALHITQSILRQLPDNQDSLWLAASKANSRYQHIVAIWLRQSGPQNLLPVKQLHHFLYFLKYAAIEDGQQRGVSPVLRMQLLQPLYRDIRKDGYFAGFLMALVKKARNGRDAAKALAYLDGIEPYLNAESYWKNVPDLARWAYGQLNLLGKNELTTPVFDGGYRWELFCLIHEWMLVCIAEIATFQPKRGRPDEYDQKYWVQMIRCHCRQFALLFTSERLNWLANADLFKANRWADVQYILEEQLTNTCGQWFRDEASRLQKREYVKAVKQWADRSASTAQKTIALYLIYHTIPSEGQYANRKLEPRLRQVLRQLTMDPDPIIQQKLREQHIYNKLIRQL